MRKISLSCLLAAGCLLFSCSSNVQRADYQVIPMPCEVTAGEGAAFKLSASTKISYPSGNADVERYAGFLAGYLQQLTGLQLQPVADAPGSGAIVLSAGLQSDNPEAYRLAVTADRIDINGASPAGVLYGIQTLRKSIPQAKGGEVSFPAVTINDAPRFAYRGAHLDVSRHFFPIDSVKSFIDMMVLHNMNKFHWHLTDDQGWRLEIKALPLLTKQASVRPRTVIGHNSGLYDSIPHGGFYTQQQVRELVDYAAERNITVIPEIDLPGHMLGALTAYPHLGCTGGPYELWQMWGVSDNVLCAGNPETYKFIDAVLAEVVELFPSEYIHVGGDECPKSRWEVCPKCQAFIKAKGLKADEHGTKEEKLQSYVIHHASDFLTSKGRKMIGWDEILEGGLAPGAIVMSWRGEGGGLQAARSGHDAIMTPNTYLYFDYYQALDRDKEPEAIGGYLPVEKVYSYEPIPASFSDQEAAHIIGVQANLWTEYIPTFSHVQYMELPRMAALCEVQWSQPQSKDYDNFLSRLPRLIAQYDACGYRYAMHVFGVKGDLTPDAEEHAIKVTLSTFDGAPIRYTLDGTEPTASSPLYTRPLLLRQTAKINAKAFRAPGAPAGSFADSVSFNKATSRPIKLFCQPSKRFYANGAATLVDGKLGPGVYSNNNWVGFYGDGLDAEIDLEEPQQISEVTLRTCVTTGDWVMDARDMVVSVSDDGKNFTQVFAEQYPPMDQTYSKIFVHTARFAPVKTRYVKVTASAERSLPAWHPGAGNLGFLFVDEIEINLKSATINRRCSFW